MTWMTATDSGVCTCLRGREAASSPTSCLATSRCAPSRSTPTASRYSLPASGTGSCPAFPCGMTSEPSMATPGAATSISLQAVSPARTSPLRGLGLAFTAHAQAFGQSSPVCLAKYDPVTHLLKIPQLSLFEASPPSLQTLPRWGWMRAGAVWGLMTSVPRTTANASGYSLPTPSSVSYGSNQGGSRGRVGPVRHSLESMARHQMWPTPDASDWKQDGLAASQRRLDLYSTVSLNAAVRLFPTPRANKWGLPDSHGSVEAWATPSARDWRSGKASPETMARNARPLSEQVGGQLNPTWVCWLQGWPLAWEARGPLSPQTFRVWLVTFQTALRACAPWAMDKSPCASPSPGAS